MENRTIILEQIFKPNEGMSIFHSKKVERAIILSDLNQLDLLMLFRRDAEDLGFYYNGVANEFTPVYANDNVIDLSFTEMKERINKIKQLIN